MRRFYRVQMIAVAVLVSFALCGGAALAASSADTMVEITFSVPTHVELEVTGSPVTISAWSFDVAPSVEGIGFGPSLVGQASVADHLTVYSNTPNWTLTYEFDANSFLASGGAIVVKLLHKVAGAPSVVFASGSGGSTSYLSNGNGKGQTSFDAVYYAVAPFNSNVDTGSSYTVQLTYTITAGS